MKKTMKITELRGLVKVLFAAMTNTGVNRPYLEWEPECRTVSINTPSLDKTWYGTGKTEDVALRKLALKLMGENMRRLNRMLIVISGARKALGPSIHSTLASEFSRATRIFRAAMRSKTGGVAP